MEWKTFQHNGVLFYPEYKSQNIIIKYNNTDIIDPFVEEYLLYFIKKKGYNRDVLFKKNFLNSLNDITSHVYNFTDIDLFSLKKFIKDVKKYPINDDDSFSSSFMKKYTYATIDGKNHKISNPFIEPPSIFVGRGDHPLRGTIKKRILPEDITLNIDNQSKIPPCTLKNHTWGNIVHDNNSTWIASWKDSITGNLKYIYLSANSNIHMDKDMNKYDIARKLKKYIKKIRRTNNTNLHSDNYKYRQLSTVVYLIDKLCLRIGNEKDDTQTADTVGATSLKVENIQLLENNKIDMHFLGKDSILFKKKFNVDTICYNNIATFIKNKKNDELIFDNINSGMVNRYLHNFMEGLTAKVFRTFRSSELFNKLLLVSLNHEKDEKDEKYIIKNYKYANLMVAKLCNHRKNKNLELSLETSKRNYLDPRITFCYSKKYNIPIEKLFSKNLIEKHAWATNTQSDFKY